MSDFATDDGILLHFGDEQVLFDDDDVLRLDVWSSFLWLLHFSSHGGLFNLLMVSSAPYMKDLVLTYLALDLSHR